MGKNGKIIFHQSNPKYISKVSYMMVK